MSILGLQLESWNIGSTETFYVNMLGFTRLADDDNPLALRIGETKLVFTQAQPNTQPSYRLTFGVASDQFDSIAADIAKKLRLLTHQGQTTILSPVTGTNAIYGYDPSGNLLEFASMQSGVPGIRGIIGVGIAVDNPDAVVGELQQSELSARAQVSSDPTIRVLHVGDHVFMVVGKRGTNWFPGRRAAEVYQMIATVPGEVNSVTTIPNYPYFIHRGSGWYTLRG
jgi:hypothetical protein